MAGGVQPGASVEEVASLLLRMIAAVVHDPSAVELTANQSDGATCFSVRVGRGDLGRVIGREGRTALAIRTVLGAIGKKLGRRYTVDLVG